MHLLMLHPSPKTITSAAQLRNIEAGFFSFTLFKAAKHSLPSRPCFCCLVVLSCCLVLSGIYRTILRFVIMIMFRSQQMLSRFSAESQQILSRVSADSQQSLSRFSADSQQSQQILSRFSAILGRFSADSQKSLSGVSADSQQTLSRFQIFR